MAANPPRFRTHYVPPAGYNPDPDCDCPLCTAPCARAAQYEALEKKVRDAQETRPLEISVEPEAPLLSPLGDPLCPDCKLVFVAPGTECQQCLTRRINAARPPLGPPMVWRDVTCPSCRRFFCKVLAVADVRIIPHCEGCEREGR